MKLSLLDLKVKAVREVRVGKRAYTGFVEGFFMTMVDFQSEENFGAHI